MANYHLYRTNILLSGQLKTDLIIDSDGLGKLKMTNIHLSPISKYVPFNYKSDENIIRYTHQENIRDFYKDIEGSFYSDYLSPEFSHDYPIISGKYIYQTTNDMYITGARRMSYNIYNKQFSYLIPLWIEGLRSDGSIRFDINLYSLVENDSKNEFKPILTKSVTIDNNSDIGKYLYNYFNYVGITDVTDPKIINIRFGESAHIRGLECDSGNVVTKDISPISYNILTRERPLLEVDNMITNCFMNNRMICRQLFNINLCFSLSDIIDNPFLYNKLQGKPLYIDVDSSIDDVVLEQRDLFNNYEEIKRDSIVRTNDGGMTNLSIGKDGGNVLDYLEDYNCVDLITKNKISNNTIHWSLIGQNNYIFNVYGGFNGLIKDDQNILRPRNQGVLCSNFNNTNTFSLSDINWVNILKSNIINNILNSYSQTDLSYVKRYDKLKNIFTKFYEPILSNENYIVNGIKYNILNTNSIETPPEYSNQLADKNTYVAIVYNNDGGVSNVINNMFTEYISEENIKIYVSKVNNGLYNNMVIILVNPGYEEEVSFYRILEKFKEYKDTATSIGLLYYIMSRVISPKIIIFKSGLYKVFDDRPDKRAQEFTYYKKDMNVSTSVSRYDGFIEPTFLNPNDTQQYNLLYYKKVYTPEEYAVSPFKTYARTGYNPLYKSIGYYSLENYKLNSEDYQKISDKLENILYKTTVEHPWFRKSKVLYLNTEYKFKLTNSEPLTSREIFNKVFPYKDNSDYLYSLYDVIINWEYTRPDDITKYNYDITIKLK